MACATGFMRKPLYARGSVNVFRQVFPLNQLQSKVHRIVIVGGGAGGLALATRLGKKLGKQGRAQVTLIDRSRTHIWKPLLHEVAAGTLDTHENEIEYMAQASYGHFRFRLGEMTGLDREQRLVHVGPTFSDRGEEIIPPRSFAYDTLVLAIGSVSNHFGLPGVAEHCLFLDTTEQAQNFQKRLLEAYMKAHANEQGGDSGALDVAIVGAGATGVELAAQLRLVSRLLKVYGLDNIQPDAVRLKLIDGAERILPGVAPRLSAATHAELQRQGVEVITAARVAEVRADGIVTRDGDLITAGLKVWAAGIKAPDFLHQLAGLETNRLNQLVVGPTLQTTRDASIFAIGDCAACDWPGHNQTVPPRAQAAHQQATTVGDSIMAMLQGRPAKVFAYKDYGSLVSLGNYTTVGNLMGNLLGQVMVEGFVARMVYLSLYKMHQVSLFGYFRTAMVTLGHLFRRSVRPSIKLH
jgi:NADH dehydrogenase